MDAVGDSGSCTQPVMWQKGYSYARHKQVHQQVMLPSHQGLDWPQIGMAMQQLMLLLSKRVWENRLGALTVVG